MRANPAPPKGVVGLADRDRVFGVPGQAYDLEGGVRRAQDAWDHVSRVDGPCRLHQVTNGEGVQVGVFFCRTHVWATLRPPVGFHMRLAFGASGARSPRTA